MLTVVSIAGKCKMIPYDNLAAELRLENDRELEGVVVSCMYAGLVKGKLNQQQRRVEIAWAMGRDVGPDDLDAMISKLDSWCTSADCVVAALQRIEDAAPENSAAGNTDEPADSNFGAAEASSNRNEEMVRQSAPPIPRRA